MKHTSIFALGLALLCLSGCAAQERVPAAHPETEKIQIVGQLETAAPTIAPQKTQEAEPAVRNNSPAPSPTAIPTAIRTEKPTAIPTPAPTAIPTAIPTEVPTPEPTPVPTEDPAPEAVEKSQNEIEREKAEQLCALAKEFLDTPYHRGGTSPENGFDPGGFVYYCLNRLGIKIKHKTSKGYSEYDRWTKIESMEELEPGDLCFFMTPGNESVNCVTIYLGGGLMIYPSSGEGKVITNKINTKYWKEAFVFARRVF